MQRIGEIHAALEAFERAEPLMALARRDHDRHTYGDCFRWPEDVLPEVVIDRARVVARRVTPLRRNRA